MSLAHDVHQLLERAGIAHALFGAGALALHGVARETIDLDFLVMSAEALKPQLWEPLRDCAEVEIRRGEADDPLRGVVVVERADERPIDVVLPRGWWERDALTRATMMLLGDELLPVVGPGDLLVLKLLAGGLGDLWDARRLLDARDDREHLEHHVEREIHELGDEVAAAWNRVRSRDL